MYADDVNLTLKRELTELIPRHTSKYLQAPGIINGMFNDCGIGIDKWN